jgi:GDPmannose 4,6-dehydratase
MTSSAASRPARRTALVIGAAGQDGTLLSARLRGDDVDVWGVRSDGSVVHDGVVVGSARISHGDPRDDEDGGVGALVARVVPDEVYYLAAHHHSSEQAPPPPVELWRRSFAVHCEGLVHVLEGVVAHAPRAHVVYASSSHVFGEPATTPQNESTPLSPLTPYAVTKAAGMGICAAYRRRGVRASSAILFNHESPLRARHFVVQRVAYAVAAAAVAGQRTVRIELGNPDAVVDWSWADDVVGAMAGIARLEESDDFVVASGVARTVRELCAAAAAHAGLDVDVVQNGNAALRRVPPLVGDAARLHSRVALSPPVPFSRWVGILVDAARAALVAADTAGPKDSSR